MTDDSVSDDSGSDDSASDDSGSDDHVTDDVDGEDSLSGDSQDSPSGDDTNLRTDSEPQELDTDALADPTSLFAVEHDDGGDQHSDPDHQSDVTNADPNRPTDDTASDPFAELDTGSDTDADPFLTSMFEQMDVGADTDADVWELLDDDAEGDSLGGPFGVGPGETAPAEAASGEDAASAAVSAEHPDSTATAHGDTSVAESAVSDHVVDKRSYCQQCPHFSSPPAVACSHEGTTIVESVDFSRFRVLNCPMVQRAETDPARNR